MNTEPQEYPKLENKENKTCVHFVLSAYHGKTCSSSFIRNETSLAAFNFVCSLIICDFHSV